MIREYLGDGSRYGVAIRYSEEEPHALETAGGIFRALPHLGPGAFLTVNGDIFTDFPFATAALARDRDAHLVLVPNPLEHPAGDFGLQQGRALPSAALQYTFGGIAVYRPQFFCELRRRRIPLKAPALAIDAVRALLGGVVFGCLGGRRHAAAAAGPEWR
jgi:MurNAc alpha-1-phosphate uridylyltransferase